MRFYLCRLGFLAALSALVASASAQRSIRYRVIEMGALGGAMSTPSGINNSGVVVGNVQYADRHIQAFIWDAANGIRRVDPFAAQSSARAINSTGQIAGSSQNGFLTEAVVWDSDLSPFVVAEASNGAVATAINDRGQAVGFREDGVFEITNEAFLWPSRDPNSLWTDLFTSNDDSFATGINDRGFVVGYVDRQAFVVAPNGALRILAGNPNFGLPAFSVAINDKGSVLVSQLGTGYLFTQAKRVTVSGGGPLFPLGLSPNDVVVGYMTTGGRSGFVWDSKNGMTVLDDVLATPGWHIFSANAINRSGQIAAFGIRNGRRRAVLLDPVRA